MAYSENPEVLRALLPSLQMLVAGEQCEWKVPGNARRWAYRVREALYIARRHRTLFPDLAEVAERFTIRIVDDDTVAAVFATATPEALMANIQTPSTGRSPAPFQMAADSTINVPSAHTLFEIIAQWNARQPGLAAKLHFPNANLTGEELTKLARWAWGRRPHGGQHGWLVIENEGSITLLPYDADLVPAAVPIGEPAPPPPSDEIRLDAPPSHTED